MQGKALLLVKEAINYNQLMAANKNAAKTGGIQLVNKDQGAIYRDVHKMKDVPDLGPTARPAWNGSGRKIFSSGDTFKHLKNNHVLGKEKTFSGSDKKGANAIFGRHEMDEIKAMKGKNSMHSAAGVKGQSQAGQAAGHQSFAKVLSPESNIVGKAEGKVLEGGSKVMKHMRNNSGEKQAYDALLPVDSKGSNGGFGYGEGKKMNRSHRKAFYRKELGMPRATNKEVSTAINKHWDGLTKGKPSEKGA